jgi:hypothetical protein
MSDDDLDAQIAAKVSAAVSHGEPLDFKILKEPWTQYMIQDKSPVRLKCRVTLCKATRTDQWQPNGDPVYGYANQEPVYVTFAPRNMKGKPTIPFPMPEEITARATEPLRFEAIDEPWVEYELTDGTILRMRLSITNIFKTPLFAIDGDPYYWIHRNIAIAFIVPAALRKKPNPVTKL